MAIHINIFKETTEKYQKMSHCFTLANKSKAKIIEIRRI
jgi:hypothetical protein